MGGVADRPARQRLVRGVVSEELRPPHCDQAVLHAPGECGYCDALPEWQQLRVLWGVAFTGHEPKDAFTGHERPDWQVPCPADLRRGRGGAHAWAGNRPAEVDPGPAGSDPRAGFGPTGREPQRTFPVESRSWWPWRWRR